MGNQQAKVGLRLDEETYQAGGVITGRVYLSLPKQHQQRSGNNNNNNFANIESLHLLFTGIEYAQVARKQNHRHSKHQRHHHHNDEPIIEKSTHVLVRNDFPLVDLRTVKAGQYEYPFELPVLSAELPSSMACYDSTNKKSFCEIRYTLLAYLVQQQPGPLQQKQLASTTSGYIPVRLTAAPRGMESPQPPCPLIMETESYPVHTCCFWNKGHLELGWQANTSQVAPGEHVQVQAVGKNRSQLEVDSITVKWMETITWKTAGGDNNSECHRRTNKRILAEQKIAVHHLVAWAPQRHDLTMNNIATSTTTTTPIQFNLQLPTDARDSYSGPGIHVRHMLIVRVDTAGGFTTTSPESACQIRVHPKCRRRQSFRDEPTTVVPVATMVDLQPATPPPQQQSTNTTHTTANHPYDTQNIVHAQVLPTDWNPIQSDVVVIPQAAAVLIDEDVVILPSLNASAPLEQDLYMNNNSNNNSNNNTGRGLPTMVTLPATSATRYQASAPTESSIMANQEEERIPLNPTATRDKNNAVMTRQLRSMITETPENLAVVLGESESNGNDNDAWLNAVRNLDPRDYSSLVAAAPPTAATSVALTLATGMGAQFQCRHVLACLWSLPDGADNVRMSVACAIGNLPADLSLANRRLMEQELRGNELAQFRQATMRG